MPACPVPWARPEGWAGVCAALERPPANAAELRQCLRGVRAAVGDPLADDGQGLAALEAAAGDLARDPAGFDVWADVVPGVVQLALGAPHLFPEGLQQLPLLGQSIPGKVAFSYSQVASLLALGFWGAFAEEARPPPSVPGPSLSFKELLSHNSPAALERTKCLLAYFHHVVQEGPGAGAVEVERCCGADWDAAFWRRQRMPLQGCEVAEATRFEDAGADVQVDFANRDLLRGGGPPTATQEEVLFGLHPELYIALLCAERLQDDEVLVVHGVRQFSSSEAAGVSFVSFTYRPGGNTHPITILCLDALPNIGVQQFQQPALLRDLNKALLGFSSSPEGHRIVTGNWGCGAFNGDPALKCLQQCMAAAVAGRPLVFCLPDAGLRAGLWELLGLVAQAHLSVGDAFSLLSNPSPNFVVRGVFQRHVIGELRRLAGLPGPNAPVSVECTEQFARAVQWLQDAAEREAAGDPAGAVAGYRRAYRLCPELEGADCY
eukprot:EG_transcript_8811